MSQKGGLPKCLSTNHQMLMPLSTVALALSKILSLVIEFDILNNISTL